MPIVLAILASLMCGYLSSQIAAKKGLNIKFHSFLGVFLGPIGVVISLLSPSSKSAIAE